MFELKKSFWISCAHKLENKNFSEEQNKNIYGKCTDFHGHNYLVTIYLRNDKIPNNGMLLNFNIIKSVFKEKIDDVYDHHCLNSFPEFENVPVTAENMAKVFYEKLHTKIPDLYAVEVEEAQGASAKYIGYK
jgi:6-pyruvoyltetrahydropterin/6-carboxytetrahydropterin synthase